MAASIESSTPDNLHSESTRCRSSSPMLFSPSSDNRFWSALRTRIDTLLENRKPFDPSFPPHLSSGECDRAKRMKEDSLLLLRGFDSVSHSLSHLSQNLDNALQGARDLARPPTLTEIYHTAVEKAKSEKEEPKEEAKQEESDDEAKNNRLKRKLGEQGDDDSHKEDEKSPKEEGNLKKAKNLAISMATKAASLARELKSIKSDLCFMQERCVLLEEENRRLRDGFSMGIRPEEDDLVRLQLEALLAEKSRLANENANLTRENQCLHQLVEYHQLTSQDLSASYEYPTRGLCLTSPPSIPEEDLDVDEGDDDDGKQVPRTPRLDVLGLCTSLDESYDDKSEHHA